MQNENAIQQTMKKEKKNLPHKNYNNERENGKENDNHKTPSAEPNRPRLLASVRALQSTPRKHFHLAIPSHGGVPPSSSPHRAPNRVTRASTRPSPATSPASSYRSKHRAPTRTTLSSQTIADQSCRAYKRRSKRPSRETAAPIGRRGKIATAV